MPIKITITETDMLIEYEGFKGRTCFETANKFKALLKKMGIAINKENIKPTKYEHVLDGIHVENGGE
jgi:hypothetical protein